jgi:hypothetical protein
MREKIPVTCEYDENGWAKTISFVGPLVVENGDEIVIERESFCTKVFINKQPTLEIPIRCTNCAAPWTPLHVCEQPNDDSQST